MVKQEVNLFVYGTLMSGHSNEHRLPKSSIRTKAVLKGFRLDTTKKIPRIFFDDKQEVQGELVSCKLSKWELFKHDLFEWKYTRTKVFVNKKPCWVYVAKH